VIECTPPPNPEVVTAAIPPLNVPTPSTAALSSNVTVPLGAPEPTAGFTVAVNVTDWPKADGLNEDTNDTSVFGAVFKFAASIAKSAQIPVQLARLNTTDVMFEAD
jgi:hypothetical protein